MAQFNPAIDQNDQTKAAQADYDRRREQVRRAQRKHREEKDKRLRKLEDELHNLYSLSTLSNEINDLQFENDILKEIMSRHSIPLPSHFEPRDSHLAQITICGDHGPQQHLSVKMPIPIQASKTSTSSKNTKENEFGEHKTINCPSLIQIGINFVLSLERPCLFHTRPSNTSEPSGHAMSMQGILLAGAPSQIPDQTSWEIPAQQLDKLFELSGYLGLDGYITPIQAWNRIMREFKVGDRETQLEAVPVERLEVLRSAMVPHIKCYGFGALMEEEIFEGLFEEIVRLDL